MTADSAPAARTCRDSSGLSTGCDRLNRRRRQCRPRSPPTQCGSTHRTSARPLPPRPHDRRGPNRRDRSRPEGTRRTSNRRTGTLHRVASRRSTHQRIQPGRLRPERRRHPISTHGAIEKAIPIERGVAAIASSASASCSLYVGGAVSRTTRVWAYDCAGQGWSDDVARRVRVDRPRMVHPHPHPQRWWVLRSQRFAASC